MEKKITKEEIENMDLAILNTAKKFEVKWMDNTTQIFYGNTLKEACQNHGISLLQMAALKEWKELE